MTHPLHSTLPIELPFGEKLRAACFRVENCAACGGRQLLAYPPPPSPLQVESVCSVGNVNFVPQFVVAWAAVAAFALFTRVNQRWNVMLLSHVAAAAMVASSSALVLAAPTPVIGGGAGAEFVPVMSSNYAFDRPGERPWTPGATLPPLFLWRVCFRVPPTLHEEGRECSSLPDCSPLAQS